MTTFNAEFDDAVIKALEKWPNVPHCFGWLHLDRRGNWLIKDAAITHRRALAFIARNYAEDEHGRWFVQNGPQRVFCSLAYTPLIFRLLPDQMFMTHTQRMCTEIERFILDDEGNILLRCELGIGLVDDRDLVALATAMQSPIGDDWLDYDTVRGLNDSKQPVSVTLGETSRPLVTAKSSELPQRFGFQPQPRALASELETP